MYRPSISISFNGMYSTSLHTDASVYMLKFGCLLSGDEFPDDGQDHIVWTQAPTILFQSEKKSDPCTSISVITFPFLWWKQKHGNWGGCRKICFRKMHLLLNKMLLQRLPWSSSSIKRRCSSNSQRLAANLSLPSRGKKGWKLKGRACPYCVELTKIRFCIKRMPCQCNLIFLGGKVCLQTALAICYVALLCCIGTGSFPVAQHWTSIGTQSDPLW